MDLCLVIGEKGGNSSWLKSNSRSILATKSQDLLISLVVVVIQPFALKKYYHKD